MKKTNDQAVIMIIRDSLIAFRIFNQLYKANNVVNPGKEDDVFDPEQFFYGPEIAFVLLGVNNNKELFSSLYDIFDKACYSDGDATKLADTVYVDWLSEINAYHRDKACVSG